MKGLRGLTALRKQAGLSNEKLAREVGVSMGHLWCVAHGKKGASPELLARLCARLGCSPNDLLGWEG